VFVDDSHQGDQVRALYVQHLRCTLSNPIHTSPQEAQGDTMKAIKMFVLQYAGHRRQRWNHRFDWDLLRWRL
jgi:hypothetical protein